MKDEVNRYVKDLFTNVGVFQLSEGDKKAIERDLPVFIAKKMTRKKFRRASLADTTYADILKNVTDSVAKGMPIHMVIPFGGYKHIWNDSQPEPDWAEVFNLRYLTDWAAPVCVAYKPGVIIEYISEDMILTRMDNYPSASLDKYFEIFSKIINWYNKKTPSNLDFRLFRVADKVDKEKLIKKVEELIPERKVIFEKLSPEEKDIEVHRSRRSVVWDGEIDMTNLNEKEREERVIESRIIELAYYEIEEEKEFLGDYYVEDNRMMIAFSFGTTPDNDEYQSLTLGTTYGSIVDHWIGRGVLYRHGDTFRPSILSRQQYEGKHGVTKIEVNNFLPFKNFASIEIIEC